MQLSTIILAGGKSKRMGHDKALIKINNLPLLKHICLEAQKLTSQVYIITSWPEKYQDIVPDNCTLIREEAIAGPLIAFSQALRKITTEWVLLLACDLPNFKIQELIQFSHQLAELNSDYIALLPRNTKGWEPLCGFYRRSCLSLLKDFINQGGTSFQKWLSLHKISELPLNFREILFNCNTPQDLELINNFQPQLTEDGSFTFFSPQFNETFHSRFGAKQEAIYKFVIPCKLPELAKQSNSIKILDICYGLGYNTAAALEIIWEINPQCHLEVMALELNENVPNQAIKYQLLNDWQEPIPELLSQLARKKYLKNDLISARIFYGDARISIGEIINTNFTADAIFLDPFSPPKCPQLWTVDFLKLVTKSIKLNGILATYSCAAAMRTALQLTGMKIGASKSVGRRSPGTVASYTNPNLPPLSPQELEHLQTKAAIPYRDLQLNDTPENILQRRLEEQNISTLEPTSNWKKRWST
jgi:molybdopterin-guanine dinucleotide biosynthesis protein A